MKKEQAELFDKVLNDCNGKPYHLYDNPNQEIKDAVKNLTQRGLIKSKSGRDATIVTIITSDGRMHLNNGGFMGEYEVAEQKRQNENNAARLVEFQITAQKRERRFIIWGVVASIISIVLAVLHY